jgi:hypothetical protein
MEDQNPKPKKPRVRKPKQQQTPEELMALLDSSIDNLKSMLADFDSDSRVLAGVPGLKLVPVFLSQSIQRIEEDLAGHQQVKDGLIEQQLKKTSTSL